MVKVNPSLDWYTGVSATKRMPPRCPFASVHRCPRFYQSLSLLSKCGSTEIEPAEDEALLKKWGVSDLCPATKEQATSIAMPADEPRHFKNFCPEVSFERFGLFASELSAYSDEINRDNAHRSLGRRGAGPEDWGWAWAHVLPLHYSECPLYSPLAHDSAKSPTLKPTAAEEVFSIKPSFHGISLDLRALVRRFREWLQARRADALEQDDRSRHKRGLE
jgi:hypothetical protein